MRCEKLYEQHDRMARPACDLLDAETPYWLCCGSFVYTHGAERCYEAESGHPERVRFGTAKEHSDWSKGI